MQKRVKSEENFNDFFSYQLNNFGKVSVIKKIRNNNCKPIFSVRCYDWHNLKGMEKSKINKWNENIKKIIDEYLKNPDVKIQAAYNIATHETVVNTALFDLISRGNK